MIWPMEWMLRRKYILRDFGFEAKYIFWIDAFITTFWTLETNIRLFCKSKLSSQYAQRWKDLIQELFNGVSLIHWEQGAYMHGRKVNLVIADSGGSDGLMFFVQSPTELLLAYRKVRFQQIIIFVAYLWYIQQKTLSFAKLLHYDHFIVSSA